MVLKPEIWKLSILGNYRGLGLVGFLKAPSVDIVDLVTEAQKWLPAKPATIYILIILPVGILKEYLTKILVKNITSAICFRSLFCDWSTELVAGEASNHLCGHNFACGHLRVSAN